MLERLFDLKARGTTAGRELRGAVTTFLTMAYILFANPGILAGAGVPQASAVACTALAAGVCCLLMGFYANFPIALASGMGLNAVVAFQIARLDGWNWQMAMGLVVAEGLIVLVLVLLGLREAVMHAIPADLRRAIAAGIGLFIAFIGVVNAGIAVGRGPVPPPVTSGSLARPETALAVVGLVVTAVLLAHKVRGALVLGILFGTALDLGLKAYDGVPFPALTVLGAPSFETVGQADVLGALRMPQALPLLLSLLLVDFFDTLGTVTAIAGKAGLHDEKGNVPRLRQILIVDSVAASVGGFCGVSSVTSYIESAAGVAEGARTGLHSVFVGLLFLAAVFLAPLLAVVPASATAPALILVGFLMTTEITKINFEDAEIAIPAFVILTVLPFTYSITHGIGYGFITYVAIKVLSLKFDRIHPLLYVVTGLFVVFFLMEK